MVVVDETNVPDATGTRPEPRSVLDDLELTPVAGVAGRYVVEVDDGWRVLHVFGGMTKALALAAARRELDRADLDFVTAQATYVAPVSAGTVAVQAEVVRSGRRGAQVRVALWSTDDPGGPVGGDLLVDVVLGRFDDDAPRLEGVAMPSDARRPADGIAREDIARSRFVDVPFHRQTEWRLTVGSMDLEAPADEPRSISWFRFHRSPLRPDGAWDPAAIAVPGDILGPAVGRGLGQKGRYFVITLQLSIQWFAPLRTEWVCQHSTVSRGAGGFATGVSELWSEDGELVALATQCAMLRPFERVAADGLRGQESQG